MLSGNPSGDMDEKLTRPSSDSKRLVVRHGNTGAVAGLNGYPNFSYNHRDSSNDLRKTLPL